MLDACIQVVVPVWTPERSDWATSRSQRRHRGLAAFTNLHSDGWFPEKIVDALVHEGIHALLFKTSVTGRLFSPPPRGHPRVTVVSPWSGRPLGLGAFTHACFVWFGLWHFWKQATSRSGRAAEFAERARKGFDDELPLLNIPSDGVRLLSPEVLAALRLMTTEARAS